MGLGFNPKPYNPKLELFIRLLMKREELNFLFDEFQVFNSFKLDLHEGNNKLKDQTNPNAIPFAQTS